MFTASELAALQEKLAEAETDALAYKSVKDAMEQKAASLVSVTAKLDAWKFPCPHDVDLPILLIKQEIL